MLVEQLAEGVRFLERVQVASLNVLDQRELEARLRCRLFYQRGHRRHASQPDRSPAPLAGDQLKRAICLLAHQDWLQDPVLANGLRQLVELLLVKVGARLPGVGLNRRDWDFPQADGCTWNQRAQPAAESALTGATHRSTPRRMSSWARSA